MEPEEFFLKSNQICVINAKTQGYIIKSVRLFWLLTFIHNEQNTTDVFPLPSEFIQEIDFYHVWCSLIFHSFYSSSKVSWVAEKSKTPLLTEIAFSPYGIYCQVRRRTMLRDAFTFPINIEELRKEKNCLLKCMCLLPTADSNYTSGENQQIGQTPWT